MSIDSLKNKLYTKSILFIVLLVLFNYLTNTFLPLQWYYDAILILPTLIAAMLVSYLFDKTFFSFGLSVDKFIFRNIITTFVLIFSTIIILFLIQLFFAKYRISSLSNNIIFDYIITFLFLAASEEIIIRGIIFKEIAEHKGYIFAIIITSLLFAILHIFNYEFNLIAALNTFLVGILLGLMVYYTGSLWCSIIYHYIWNLSLALILESNVSGFEYKYLIDFEPNISNLNNFWLGGNYGIEGGLIVTILITISIIIFFRIYIISPYSEAKRLRKKYYNIT